MSHLPKQKIQFHFQQITTKTPKNVTNIYETKMNKIPKPSLPIKNHVLYNFCPSEKVIKEEYSDQYLEINGLVDFVVDSYMDMGELYHGEKIETENNVEYNPMNFSLRHYISSK